MSVFDRAHMPDGEEDRLRNNALKILAVLKEKPRTNAFLSTVALDYCRGINRLRFLNYHIRSERIKSNVKGGLWLYTLLDRPDPEYEVDIQTIFPDGFTHVHTVTVNANNVGKARNTAQHGKIKTKILVVRKKPTPEPPALRVVGKPFASFK